ncbi:TolC family protein [Candidatus Binatia bacterium]|nr:TolC family protein [Candidatus Binatia bacterium]
MPSLAGCATLGLRPEIFEAPPHAELGKAWRPGPDAARAASPADEALLLSPVQVPAPGSRLRLDELLDDALLGNPSTRRVWQDAQTAAAQWNVERGRYLPRVYGNVSVVDVRAAEVAGKQPPVNAVREPGIAIDYLLFDFGKRDAAVESARQLVFAANWRYDQNVQDVLLRVAAAYYALVGRRALVAADEESLADAQLVLRAADERLKVGSGTIVDVYQARAGVARIELDLATDRGAVENARGALATAVGWPANTRFEIADPPRDLPLDLVEEDVDALIARAQSLRPELGAARAQVLREEAQVAGARAAFLPELVAAASYNRQVPQLGGPNDGAYDQYRYGLEVNVPLFQGFQRWNELQAAESRRAASGDELRDRTQVVIGEVWSAYYDFRTALARLRASAVWLASARESYRAALASYRDGVGDVVELLNGLAQLAVARAASVNARTDLFTSHAVLLRAIGEDVAAVKG